MLALELKEFLHNIKDHDYDFVYCSECEDSYYSRPIDASWDYCPYCGCRMVEPQESEDRECR